MGNAMKNSLIILVYRFLFALLPSSLICFFSGYENAILLVVVIFALLTLLDCYRDSFLLFIYRAEAVPEKEAQEVSLLLKQSSQSLGVLHVKIYVLPSACSNAFVLQRNSMTILVLGQGLFRILQADEIKALFTYLLTDAKNPKTLLKVKLAVMSGSIYSIIRKVFLLLKRVIGLNTHQPHQSFSLLTICSLYLWQRCLKIHQFKEEIYLTDQKCVKNPLVLGSALLKMEQDLKKYPLYGVNPFTANLFVLNPLPDQKRTRSISWQPPLEYRLQRLEAQARELGL